MLHRHKYHPCFRNTARHHGWTRGIRIVGYGRMSVTLRRGNQTPIGRSLDNRESSSQLTRGSAGGEAQRTVRRGSGIAEPYNTMHLPLFGMSELADAGRSNNKTLPSTAYFGVHRSSSSSVARSSSRGARAELPQASKLPSTEANSIPSTLLATGVLVCACLGTCVVSRLACLRTEAIKQLHLQCTM